MLRFRGQPIAYTIRFLKDGRLAKMGYSTDYTEVVCERHPHGWVGFRHSGASIAKFFMNWKEGNQQKSWKSDKKTAGYSDVIRLKGNIRDINVTAQAATGLAWDPWGTIFKLKLDGPLLWAVSRHMQDNLKGRLLMQSEG